MFEKVNPKHPDKIADRIAGAIVDYAYTLDNDPKIAVEVLIGHGKCHIIAETSVHIDTYKVSDIVTRIAEERLYVIYDEYKQDEKLSDNQAEGARCGDNGIFKGVPFTTEQMCLASVAKMIYEKYSSDGKYILADGRFIICQSNAEEKSLKDTFAILQDATINPLGDWTGGIDVDTGATNRKLGSDMGDSVTGGGLHGKDLSKADVSVNIYAFIQAQKLGKPVELHCAIGDDIVDGKPYRDIVEIARSYIKSKGGFEKFAEWGFI